MLRLQQTEEEECQLFPFLGWEWWNQSSCHYLRGPAIEVQEEELEGQLFPLLVEWGWMYSLMHSFGDTDALRY
jgi:hypothetical protein